MELKKIRISARISDLARLQAYRVGTALQEKNPGLDVEYKFRKSLGDINLSDPLWKMPEKGVFTQDFLKDLREDETDLVVHSWKDLPTEVSPDTEIVATLPRADQRDLLLFKKNSIGKNGVKIFSSSPRREYNLKAALPELLPGQVTNLEFLPVRGNVQTRVRKWKEDSSIDGLVVAKAAIDRLLSADEVEFVETREFLKSAIKNESWMVLPLSLNPTAAAQGALAVEIKKNRSDLKEILKKINHPETFDAVQSERKILKSYGGGCHQKIGITHSVKDCGIVESLKGLTDQGQVLSSWQLLSNQVPPKLSPEQLVTIDSDVVGRQTVNSPEPRNFNGYLVARSEALPSDWNLNGILWAAGVQTWKKLARRGVWVSGSNDGLGEEIPRVEHLIPTLEQPQLEWYKLTHQKTQVSSDFKVMVTYEIDTQKITKNEFQNKKMAFWKSGSQFTAVKEAFGAEKWDLEFHACGPGSTYEFLKTQVANEKLFVFLNEKEWKEKCQN